MGNKISSEMRLFSESGERLYLNARERHKFLAAAEDEEPIRRIKSKTNPDRKAPRKYQLIEQVQHA